MGVTDWPPADEFADRFAKLRRVLGVSNQQIAAATGVGADTVSKWANGQLPAADKILSLARYLGVTVEYLIEGAIELGRMAKPVIPPRSARAPYPATPPGKPIKRSR